MTVPRTCSVGLDIGGTKVLGVLWEDGGGSGPGVGGGPGAGGGRGGAVRATVRVPTRQGIDGVVGAAAEVVERLCAEAGLLPAHLAGVGAGVPGLVDPRSGEVSHAVNLGIAERGAALAPVLAARLRGVPVTVENDLNVAAVGAARVLGLDGDLAFLGLGTGVAAGLLLGGGVRRGARGGAGEIGHIPYDPAGRLCPCGQRGCLEMYASGAAVDAAWPGRDGRPAAASLFAAAAAGDAAAGEVRDAYADAVAAAVRLLVLTCDVEHVVLGGGVAEVGRPLLDQVSARLDRQAEGSPFLRSLRLGERLRIVPGGIPVAPIGAALLASARAVAGAADGAPDGAPDGAGRRAVPSLHR